jgi:hypothetical protein
MVSQAANRTASVLIANGRLDTTTYRPLRDSVIEASLDDVGGVVVDVSPLEVPTESAWSVFTSAQLHMRLWPGKPLLLVCENQQRREVMARNGITRCVPVYRSALDAIRALPDEEGSSMRRRAALQLPGSAAALERARVFVRERLTAWSRPELIAVAKLLVTVLVENVLAHTGCGPEVRLESRDDVVTMAVADDSTALATRREPLPGGKEDVSGLAIVAALSRGWGNTPTGSGKYVWATVGPENQL